MANPAVTPQTQGSAGYISIVLVIAGLVLGVVLFRHYADRAIYAFFAIEAVALLVGYIGRRTAAGRVGMTLAALLIVAMVLYLLAGPTVVTEGATG